MDDDTGFDRGEHTGRGTGRNLHWVVLLAAVMVFDMMALAGWFR